MTQRAPTLPAALRIDDPSRCLIGRGVLGSLYLAVLFILTVLPIHFLPTIFVYGPWAQDPYHVVVSFAVLFVPLLLGLAMARVPLCRRDAPLPTRRARDLLRTSRILVLVVLATVASAWISVALPAQRYSLTAPTVAAFAELAALTTGLVWAGRRLWRASKTPMGEVSGPDWLADVVVLGDRVASRLGVLAGPAVAVLHWTDFRIINATRRRPLLATTMLSALCGMAVAIVQGAQEGYSSGGYLLFFMVAACGTFAFTTIVGNHLGVVAQDETSCTATHGKLHRSLVHAAVAASATVPLAIAFRPVIWSALGINGQRAGWAELNLLVLGTASVTAILATVIESLRRRRG